MEGGRRERVLPAREAGAAFLCGLKATVSRRNRMKIQHKGLAGWPVTAPNGHTFTMDAQGCAEVPEDCGIHLVPEFTVLEGVPQAAVTPQNEVVEVGYEMLIQGPRSLANQCVACPDGSQAQFDANAQTRVLSTTRLHEVPEFRVIGAQNPPAAAEPEQTQTTNLEEIAAQELAADLAEDEETATEEPAAPARRRVRK